jgi:hypothetical protein
MKRLNSIFPLPNWMSKPTFISVAFISLSNCGSFFGPIQPQASPLHVLISFIRAQSV